MLCAYCRGGFVLDRAVVALKLRPLALPARPMVPLPPDPAARPAHGPSLAWRSRPSRSPGSRLDGLGWPFRLIDLGMILYGRSERLHDRRSLSDMIVPTAANGLKLSVLLLAISCQVYMIGSRETLTHLLAGLGLIGFAASLAAQDTLKNFFGTLLLIGEHLFRIGEHIAVQEHGGVGRERRLPLDPAANVRGPRC